MSTHKLRVPFRDLHLSPLPSPVRGRVQQLNGVHRRLLGVVLVLDAADAVGEGHGEAVDAGGGERGDAEDVLLIVCASMK